MKRQSARKEIKKILKFTGSLTKQWGFGEPVGRVWGFLLLKQKPLRQEEIEKGTQYSRGLVSRSLKKLAKLGLVKITRKGRYLYYGTTSSLINGFNKMIQAFLQENTKLVKELNQSIPLINDHGLKKCLENMVREYALLKKSFVLLSKINEQLLTLNTKTLASASKLRKQLESFWKAEKLKTVWR